MKNPPTEAQINYVRILQRGLRLSDRLLDTHCVREYGCLFRELSRSEMSALIDQFKSWQMIPAELQREIGQQDLPGFGAMA